MQSANRNMMMNAIEMPNKAKKGILIRKLTLINQEFRREKQRNPERIIIDPKTYKSLVWAKKLLLGIGTILLSLDLVSVKVRYKTNIPIIAKSKPKYYINFQYKFTIEKTIFIDISINVELTNIEHNPPIIPPIIPENILNSIIFPIVF